MSIATVGAGYQAVIPRRERERLRLRRHSKVRVEVAGGAAVMRPLPDDGWGGR